MEILSFILILAVSFIASIIGTIIGSAMLILPPTMIFFGIPPHTAVATGRFSMVGVGIGNATRFSMRNMIQLKYVIPFAAAGIVGAVFGALSLKRIDGDFLKILMGILMMIISVLLIFEDYLMNRKIKANISFKSHLLSIISGLFLGAYIGVIGGGGATIVILLLVLIYGLNFRDAVANQKAVTLPISIIATIIFIYQGLIDYRIGIPLFLVNMVGGWVGVGLLMKFDSKWLKRIIIPIIILLAIKLILSSVTISKW